MDNIFRNYDYIYENLEKIKANIVKLRANSSFSNEAVELLAVSKYRSVEEILAAKHYGATIFGENRPQALRDKIADERLISCPFDLIGTLQKNKIKYVLGKVRYIHSVDSLALLEILENEALKRDCKQDVLLQINYSQENQKHGFTVNDIYRVLEMANDFKAIKLVGLMTMAAASLSEDELNRFFFNFRNIYDSCNEDYKAGFSVLSMGMSNDYQAAVKQGSNCVRIGRAIFEKY